MIRFPTFGSSNADDAAAPAAPTPKTPTKTTVHPLDHVTGGVFSAATSSERAARLRAWLASEPEVTVMQEVYKELSSRDKGAARPLREKLDEIKRSKGQELLANEWASKAQALLQTEKLHIADAMAWQRDAAKAGAPLSKEPLISLKNQLAERIKGIEDLQTRVQIQREAAVLLAQRIELLSVKSWRDADAAASGLQTDVAHWLAQAQDLQQDANWHNIDPKYVGQIDSATKQLQLVAQAFMDALEQTRLAANDMTQPLPPVPIWADELRAQRGEKEVAPVSAENHRQAGTSEPKQTALPPEAQQAIESALQTLEQEITNGYSKASMAAAQALRSAVKKYTRFLDASMEAKIRAVLTKADELEGWQRWRADQIRQELVQKAEALINSSTAPTAADEATADAKDSASDSAVETPADAASSDTLPTSSYSPRKLQETLRQLREQWKQTDQGGVPNHALWKRFDHACNEAYRIVEHWLGEMKQNAAAQRSTRLLLLDELKAWGEQLAHKAANEAADWKLAQRELFDFGRRWREAGHLSEKVFSELQPQWKAALQLAGQPLQLAQEASVVLRQQMIEEAKALCAQASLRIDAIKHLQQRWQHEAQHILLERKQEQKLWDAFRKPIDEAFQRKHQQREHENTVQSQHDSAVLEAAKALDAASASGDAQAIRQAMQLLETALQSSATDTAGAPNAADVQSHATQPVAGEPAASEPIAAEIVPGVDADVSTDASNASATPASSTDSAQAPSESTQTPATSQNAPKPVVAVRGDDRRNTQKPTALSANTSTHKSGSKFSPKTVSSNRKDRNRADEHVNTRPQRLGNAAFHAQRNALENAHAALRKLAVQAHGQTVTQLLDAWQQRQPEAVPTVSELGKAINSQQRSQWLAALSAPAGSNNASANALLRLEIAAAIPSPAEQLDDRRALQLHLLTRRNDPAPADTWAQDLAHIFAEPFDEKHAKRLQGTLHVLLKRSR